MLVPRLNFMAIAMGLAAIAALHAAPTNVSAQNGREVSTNVPDELISVRDGTVTSVVLSQDVSLDLRRVPLQAALEEISRQAGLSIVINSALVPARHRVTLLSKSMPTGAALARALEGTSLDLLVTRNGEGVLVKRPPPDSSRNVSHNDFDAVGLISGRVTSAGTGEGIPSADVRVENTRLSTTTNAEGRFRLTDVPVGEQMLVVERLGYGGVSRSVTVAEGAEVTVDIVMELRPAQLNELVVTATGQQRRLEVGHATATIRADSVTASAPVFTLNDLLNGRVAGVQILSGSGETGHTGAIRIRGINSFTLSNDPLIVIDGVRADNRPGSGTNPSFAFGGGFNPTSTRTSRLLDVNPEDIESIEVVKGPAAGTLYGTDASNGVVLIQTKRGRAGPARWIAYLEHGRLDLDGYDYPRAYYTFGRSTSTGAPMRCPLLNRAAGECMADSVVTFSPLQDRDLSPLAHGPRSQYGVQVSGGVTGFSYFVSGEYETETGPYRMPARDRELLLTERGTSSLPDWQERPNSLQRYALRTNFAFTTSHNFDIAISAGFSNNRTHHFQAREMLRGAAIGPGYRDFNDGWLPSTRPGIQFSSRQLDVTSRLLSSLAANWRPLSWLQARVVAGADLSAGSAEYMNRRGEGSNLLGAVTQTRATTRLYSFQLGTTATAFLASQISSRTSVGFQYDRRLDEVTIAAGRDLTPGAETVAGAAIQGGATSLTPAVVAGAYLEQQFGYGERLFLTGAARADGASTFGADFSAAIYPKASVSWIAIDNSRSAILTSLRVRAAYGESGVQPGAVDALVRYQTAGVATGGVGATLASAGNPNLGPERSGEWELGFDAEFLRARLHLDATAYHRVSKDAIAAVPLGAEFGNMTRLENVGSVRNLGLEGLITARLIDMRQLSLDLTLNGSVNQNRLLKLPGNVPFIGSAGDGIRHVVGYPLSGFWARRITGFSDANGNGIIEPNEITATDTSVFVGPVTPTRQLSITPQLSLLRNAVQLSAQFNYRGGNTLWANTEWLACGTDRRCRASNDPTTPLAEQAKAASTLRGEYQGDGDFVRLRELSLRWNVPGSLAARAGARSATVTLAGRNLATWTEFPGADPEQAGYFPDSMATAAEHQPPARVLVARIGITF